MDGWGLCPRLTHYLFPRIGRKPFHMQQACFARQISDHVLLILNSGGFRSVKSPISVVEICGDGERLVPW